MHTIINYTVYNMKNTKKPYTLRNIPERVDRNLKKRARETGKSFNQASLSILVLDSNRYTDLCKGDSNVIEVVENASEIFLPLIVLLNSAPPLLTGPDKIKTKKHLPNFLIQKVCQFYYQMNKQLFFMQLFTQHSGKRENQFRPMIFG